MAVTDEIEIVSGTVERKTDGFVIRVLVTNTADRPLYVGCGSRQIQLDSDTGTLTYWMSDHGRTSGDPGGRCRLATTPDTVIVEAGTTHEIEKEVPAFINRIFLNDAGEPDGERIDLLGATRIDVRSLVSDRPFYAEGPMPTVEQTCQWGEPIGVICTEVEAAS